MNYKQKNLCGRIAQFLFIAGMCMGVGTSALSADNIITPLSVIDAVGDEIAVWVVDTTAGDSNVWSANRPSAGTWSTPVKISGSEFQVNGAKLIASADGSSVVAAWVFVNTDLGIFSLAASQFSTNTGTWTTPAVISTTGQDVAQDFNIAINSNGQVILLWDATLVSTGVGQLWLSSLSVGSWTSAQVS